MLRKSLFGFLSLGLIALATSPVKADTTAATINGAVTAVGTGMQTQSLGFDFVATTNINITSLGIYNANNTLAAGQTVILYDVTTTTQVGSVAVGAPGAAGTFDYAAFNYSVKAGDIYSVYSVFTGAAYGFTGSTPSITLASGLGNVLPPGGTNTQGGLYNNSGGIPGVGANSGAYTLVATNFTFTPATVPEPASISMLGLGIAGVAFAARRKMAKRSA